MKITQEELNRKIILHQRWIEDERRGEMLDLRKEDLSNLCFYCRDLSRADFTEAIMVNASMYQTTLNGAIFKKADLLRANFSGAEIIGASFDQAILSETDFTSANLTGSHFYGAHLFLTKFFEANLTLSDFHAARLDSVNFHSAYISGSGFQNAILEKCIGITCARLSFTGKLCGYESLLGVLIDGEIIYFDGIFRMNEKRLIERIKKNCYRQFAKNMSWAHEVVKKSIEMSLGLKQ